MEAIIGLSIVMVFLIVGGVITAMVFFYIHLMKLLNKCAPENRGMDGGMVWLNFIPLFCFGWMIYTVIKIRDSLQAEFAARGLETDDPNFGFGVGLSYAICLICSIIPVLGIFSSIGALILLIIYWVKTHKYSKLLD